MLRYGMGRNSYRRVFDRLPRFLQRRINPLDFAIEDLARQAGSLPGRLRVLDAGAGEARFAPFFSRHQYVSLDLAVGDAAWDYSRLQVRGDLQSLPFSPCSIDLVLNFQVLEHVPDPAAVLREMARVLKPGGRLLLTAPQGWAEHQQPHDYFRFTSFSLRSMLKAAGFESITVEPMGGYFHYLGHRLTFIPKILFQRRAGVARVVLFPAELLSLILFCLVAPLGCYYLDRLDRRPEFTLGYRCEAWKPCLREEG